MIKFLFLDYRDLETVDGFVRKLEPPKKHPGNPLLVADLPSEVDLMSFYGSVIRRPTDGKWQLWYKCYNPNGRGPALGYAESADGLKWIRPGLDVVKFQEQNTNIVFDRAPHGTAVIYDARDERPDWKYKMVHGCKPTERLSAQHSPDGIHWHDVGDNPILGRTSGGPIGLLRANDGRYVLYIRPTGMDRRVARSESWDFIHWTEPRVVIDQDPKGPMQVQYYGMDGFVYGAYEMGLLWIYQTVASDMDFYKHQGRMEPELAYSRSGWAWHRAAPREPWIRLGEKGTWDYGQIHPASEPVFLEDEIRFYYSAAKVPHEITTRGTPEPQWGIGFSSCKPDRFVCFATSPTEGRLLTRPFWTDVPFFCANADIARDGYLRVEITDVSGKTIPGFNLSECEPVSGASTRHVIRWRAGADPATVVNRDIRLRVLANNAKLYSLFSGSEAESPTYWTFRIPGYAHMEAEKAQT